MNELASETFLPADRSKLFHPKYTSTGVTNQTVYSVLISLIILDAERENFHLLRSAIGCFQEFDHCLQLNIFSWRPMYITSTNITQNFQVPVY